MKKHILFTFLLVLFVFPQVTHAAWWNPLSWFNSRGYSTKTDSETKILENRIQELEKKLSNNSATTPTPLPITTSTDEVKDSDEVITPKKVDKKTVTTNTTLPVNRTGVIKPIVTQPTTQAVVPPVNLGQATTDLISKFNILGEQVRTIITDSGSGLSFNELSVLNQILPKIDSGLYDLRSTNPSQKNVDYYTTQYNNIHTSFTGLGFHIKTAQEKAAEAFTKQAADEAQAKAEKANNLIKVNMKLAELRGYFQQIQLINPNTSSQTVVEMLPSITDLNGNRIFTVETTPWYDNYHPSLYVQGVLFVIQKEITKLTILQAQYSN